MKSLRRSAASFAPAFLDVVDRPLNHLNKREITQRLSGKADGGVM